MFLEEVLLDSLYVSVSPKLVCFSWSGLWLINLVMREWYGTLTGSNKLIFYTYFASASPKLRDIHVISTFLMKQSASFLISFKRCACSLDIDFFALLLLQTSGRELREIKSGSSAFLHVMLGSFLALR